MHPLKTVAPFTPHPLVRGGHLQTIVGRFRDIPVEHAERVSVEIPLDDGQHLHAYVDVSPPTGPNAPTILLFHGLGGCSSSGYLLRMSQKFRSLGYRVVRINHRGCGPQEARPGIKIYHSGSTQDAMAALSFAEQQWPDSPLLAVGYSISGTILLNLAGQCAGQLRKIDSLRGFAALSSPMDLEMSSRALAAPKNWIYDRYFTRFLLQRASNNGWLDELNITPQQQRSMTLRKFDEYVTAPIGGFTSRSDYYEQCSPNRNISEIQVPTLIIQASNDPIVPPSSYDGLEVPGQVWLRQEDCGGHMGFISRHPTHHGDHRWLDAALIHWATALLS